MNTLLGTDMDPVLLNDGSKSYPRHRHRSSSGFGVLTCIASCCLGYTIGHFSAKTHLEKVAAKIETTGQEKVVAEYLSTGRCSDPMKTQGVPTFKTRDELGSIIESENMTVGVELGVQSGDFSKHLLESWPSWVMQRVFLDGGCLGSSRKLPRHPLMPFWDAKHLPES